MSTTHTSLIVGEIDGDTAVLSSSDLLVIRLPLALLPPGVAPGHAVDMVTTRSTAAEKARESSIRSLQAELRARLGPAPMSTAALIFSHEIVFLGYGPHNTL